MSTPPLATPATTRGSALLGGLLAAVATVALVGAVLAARVLTGGAAHAPAPPPSGPFGVAQDVPTSFGFVAVEHAETIKGLSAKQLGGAIHGIGSFVGRDRALVKPSATLRTGVRGTLDYSIGQFPLRATGKDGQVRRYPVSHATVGDGT